MVEGNENLKRIEELENKYLEKYYYFLKFAESDILAGLETKDYIRNDWIGKWGNDAGTSDFAVGAERIVYALLNGKGIGQPNSCPVGADLMFEVDDAIIHIDMKTVCTDNIGDATRNIFVGENQNSYKGTIVKNAGRDMEDYVPNLPYIYTVNRKNYKEPVKKTCLSYFIVILYDKENLDTLYMLITCMPNGLLEPIYGSDILSAGKNPGKARYNFLSQNFKLLNNKLRTRVVYLNERVRTEYSKPLKNIIELYDNPLNK